MYNRVNRVTIWSQTSERKILIINMKQSKKNSSKAILQIYVSPVG